MFNWIKRKKPIQNKLTIVVIRDASESYMKDMVKALKKQGVKGIVTDKPISGLFQVDCNE